MSFKDMILKLLDLKCSQCSYQFKPEDLQMAQSNGTKSLTCPQCQTVTQLEPSQENGLDKTHVEKSGRIKMERQNNTLSITLPWRGYVAYVLIAASIIWILSSLSIYETGIRSGLHINGVFTNDPAIIFKVTSLFSAVGFIMLAAGIIWLLNKTIIKLSSTKVLVTTSPFPIGSTKLYPVSEIRNFSVQKKVIRQKGHVHKIPMLYINFKNGNAVKICQTKSISEAIYIEQTIESFLNITDQKNLDLAE